MIKVTRKSNKSYYFGLQYITPRRYYLNFKTNRYRSGLPINTNLFSSLIRSLKL